MKTSESDRFIASIPAGRQAEQARAVREAIRGNSAELEAIRRSRDIEKPLIAGVPLTDAQKAKAVDFLMAWVLKRMLVSIANNSIKELPQ